MVNGNAPVILALVSLGREVKHRFSYFVSSHFMALSVEQEALVPSGVGQGVVHREVMPINRRLDTMAPLPVNIAELERELVGYNPAAAVELLDGFINGFKINYSGPCRPTDSRNIK